MPEVSRRRDSSNREDDARYRRREAYRSGEVTLGVPGRAMERMRIAVWERLPLWVQLRCGTDPKALGALALVLGVAVTFAVHHFWTGSPEPVRAPVAEQAVAAPGPNSRPPSAHGRGQAQASMPSGAGGPPGDAGRRLVVDVTGKVRHPGIHRLPPGSRVTDALQAAGGALPGANTAGLNQARLLADGEQIVVGTGAAGSGQVAGAGGAGASGGAAGPGAGAGNGPPGAVGLPAGPVSLNTATEQQLDALPGVGPVMARHIIEFRTRHGGFTSVDQLRQVKGIGERRFADLRPLVQP
ncbi:MULTISPECIES: ComEA family DNA-binding protein [Streptomyces]|uniref:ComEA family DNA-binding protein n=1 Tax=Streptomyces TaxID=1883 RepID=UPI001FCFBFEA|nr:ComEA family DNA-binding protein [Streptomyces kasugaensis]